MPEPLTKAEVQAIRTLLNKKKGERLTDAELKSIRATWDAALYPGWDPMRYSISYFNTTPFPKENIEIDEDEMDRDVGLDIIMDLEKTEVPVEDLRGTEEKLIARTNHLEMYKLAEEYGFKNQYETINGRVLFQRRCASRGVDSLFLPTHQSSVNSWQYAQDGKIICTGAIFADLAHILALYYPTTPLDAYENRLRTPIWPRVVGSIKNASLFSIGLAWAGFSGAVHSKHLQRLTVAAAIALATYIGFPHFRNWNEARSIRAAAEAKVEADRIKAEQGKWKLVELPYRDGQIPRFVAKEIARAGEDNEGRMYQLQDGRWLFVNEDNGYWALAAELSELLAHLGDGWGTTFTNSSQEIRSLISVQIGVLPEEKPSPLLTEEQIKTLFIIRSF